MPLQLEDRARGQGSRIKGVGYLEDGTMVVVEAGPQADRPTASRHPRDRSPANLDGRMVLLPPAIQTFPRRGLVVRPTSLAPAGSGLM